MSSARDLNMENMVTVMLMQALCGAISPNFRRVSLELREPTWRVRFVLELEDAVDREEIADAIGEFDSLLLAIDGDVPQFDSKIVVSNAPLAALDPEICRAVFCRRES